MLLNWVRESLAIYVFLSLLVWICDLHLLYIYLSAMSSHRAPTVGLAVLNLSVLVLWVHQLCRVHQWCKVFWAKFFHNKFITRPQGLVLMSSRMASHNLLLLSKIVSSTFFFFSLYRILSLVAPHRLLLHLKHSRLASAVSSFHQFTAFSKQFFSAVWHGFAASFVFVSGGIVYHSLFF